MKKNWQKVKLKDICECIDYGYTASASDEPIGPKFLRITDIVPAMIDWNGVPYCMIEPQRENKYRLKEGDIVIARTGATTGYAKRIKNPPASIFASYLVRIRLKSEYDNRFFGHVVESNEYKAFIKKNLGGSAQPNANAQILTSFSVNVPPLPTQRRIADILSAYDDLIENNTRRIKILEDMAQTIYREWFVKFRSPGHEKVKMIDSPLGKIPEGWEIKTVEQIAKRIPSGRKYDAKTANKAGKVPILDQGQSGIIGYHDNDPGVVATEEKPIIVFANHTCYQRLVLYPFSAIQNVLPFVPSDDKSRDIVWLHYATKDLIKFNDYKGHWPEFMGKKLALPPETLSSLFGLKAGVLIRQAYKHEAANNILRQIRDLLLPKLVGGEVEG